MADGQDQLRQRMIFALSQIIVVSANKNSSGTELVPWVRLLSRNAFGNFRTLLREVDAQSDDGQVPGQLAFNRCTRNTATCPNGSTTSVPNENYARELLQLFTLGLWELNSERHRAAEWRRPADPHLHPGHAGRIRPRAHRLDLRAPQQHRRLPRRDGAGMTTGTPPQPRYHDTRSRRRC